MHRYLMYCAETDLDFFSPNLTPTSLADGAKQRWVGELFFRLDLEQWQL